MQRLLPLLLLALLPNLAAAVGLPDVIATLERPFQLDAPAGEAIGDFHADFFQESHLASLDQSQRGRGTVRVKFARNFSGRAPLALFHWQYQVPNRQEIVSDGDKLWVYLPDNHQVIESDLSAVNRADANNPMTFLTGLGNLSRDFSILFAVPNYDSAGNYILELRPRRTSSLISRLFIVVSRDAVMARAAGRPEARLFPMLSTTVIDPNDNKTIIEFSNIRVNNGFSQLGFRFMIPPGVEVVRPTGTEMGF